MTTIDIKELQKWIGHAETKTDRVTQAPVDIMAATLDRDDRSLQLGTVLPLPWHWLYFLPNTRSKDLNFDGHPRAGTFLPPAPLPRRMWAGSRISADGAPLKVGDCVTRESTIAAIKDKTGTSGDLIFIQVRHRISSAHGLSLIEEQDIVYRAEPSANIPSAPGKAARLDHQWVRKIVPSAALLFRFSALTFNSHRIHYDQPYATQVEGYPGLVVHGPLIATLLLDLVYRELPDIRVKRFEFRAVKPLFDIAPFYVCAAPVPGKKSLTLWAKDDNGFVATEASLDFE